MKYTDFPQILRSKTLLQSIAALALIAASPVHALVVSYTDSATAYNTHQFLDTVSLPQFDATFGKLEAIEISVTSSIRTDRFGIENLQDGARSSTMTKVFGQLTLNGQSVSVDYSDTDTTPLTHYLATADAPLSLAAYDGTTDFQGASGFSTFDIYQEIVERFTVQAADFDQFIGGGTMAYDFEGSTGVSITMGGNARYVFSAENFTTAGVQIDYHYTPIAATLPLLVTGLGALGLAGRHRSRRLVA